VLVVRGTRKFLERVGPPSSGDARSTGVLGDWYANALFWRPQVALFVNERTRLPVFVPLAPAKSVINRLPVEFEKVARDLGVDGGSLDAEVAGMREWALAKTASRSVLGSMNEFVLLADSYRWSHDEIELTDMSVWLAHAPCLVASAEGLWPDREVRTLLG
jgi:hypothetical protein